MRQKGDNPATCSSKGPPDISPRSCGTACAPRAGPLHAVARAVALPVGRPPAAPSTIGTRPQHRRVAPADMASLPFDCGTVATELTFVIMPARQVPLSESRLAPRAL